MSNSLIKTVYADATKTFKDISASHLGVSAEQINRKRVPKLEKRHLSTGRLFTIDWEPEDGVLFAQEKDLYSFPKLLENIKGVTLIPNMGLGFQTATLAYVPKISGTPLDRLMMRMRFDFEPRHHGTWNERAVRNILFGAKDSGKAIDRMELERALKTLKLRKALKSFQKEHGQSLGAYPELANLTPNQLRTGAMTALSRAAFFGIHYLPNLEVAVDYQFSMDYCRNSRPKLLENGTIMIDGNRFEAEGEAFGTYSARELSEDQRINAIKTSLNILWGQLRQNLALRNIATIETEMNKAEFARSQVAENYGLDQAKKDDVKASDYTRQPLLRALTGIFDGSKPQGLVAMPTPFEIRHFGGLEELKPIAA